MTGILSCSSDLLLEGAHFHWGIEAKIVAVIFRSKTRDLNVLNPNAVKCGEVLFWEFVSY
jgi:hypothetical protein